ncbi:MAG TPA: hypothetical protein VFP39_08630 [Gemmatimonadales bacterium]|nr:hypothetical protein [Gemmatimonadales bacterium]
MIRLPAPVSPGAAGAPDQRQLLLLTELARLIPVTDPSADVVRMEVTDRPESFTSPSAWRTAGWGIEPGDGVVRIARGALQLAWDLATAAAEARATVLDRFDRVPASANALVAAGVEREPLVSQAAMALRRAATRAAGRRPLQVATPWPDGRRWAIALTHDLDIVALWPAFTALRLLELGRKGHWRLAARAAGQALKAIGRAPVEQGTAALLAAEQAHSVRSTWFILCGTPTLQTFTAGDLTYRPEAAATRRILAAVTAARHAIGLHGSRETVLSPERFTAQRDRLRRLGGQAVAGVRQHFLRFDPARTPQAMTQAGFRYDSTVGFPDRNGFRLGVADVVRCGDTLDEVPFAWMDRALSKYRDVEDPHAWIDDALILARGCRDVEGLWVGVWHPNLTDALGFPGAPAAYERLLDALLADRPFVGTLDEIVDWRAKRRALRIERVAEDGRCELSDAASVPLETTR